MWATLVVLAAELAASQTRRSAASDRIVDAARRTVEAPPKLARRDCSGLVETILARAGRPARGNTRSLYADAKADGRLVTQPKPGHLAFFDHTWDENGNGRVDDPLSHVAIVVAVDGDGGVELVHYGSGRPKILRLHLRSPDVHRQGGRVLNDYLRQPGFGPADGPRLAGQRLRGFAKPPPGG